MRSQTTATVTLVFFVAMLIATVAMLGLLRRSLVAEVDRSNENRLNDLIVQIETAGVVSDPGFGADNDTFSAIMLFSTGEVLASSDEAADGDLLIDASLDEPDFFDADLSHLEYTLGVDNMRATIGFPLSDDEFATSSVEDTVANDDDLVVFVASSLDGVDRTLSSAQRLALVVVPLLTALVGLMTWLVTRHSLRPVDRMRSEVDEITASNLDRRVAQPSGTGSIALLGTTMNSMLSRIGDSQTRQQQFVSDASHELRSPLASMKAQLDVDLAHSDTTDWEVTAESLRSETERMQRMIEDLLLLARADAGQGLVPQSLVDLDDTMLAVAGSEVDTTAVSAGLVRGNADHLHRVAENLVSNARRHAVQRVAVGVSDDGDTVTMWVDDDGSGIALVDRSAIFERFVRLDEARTRDAGGSGLGLAISSEIVTAHGGTLAVEESPLGGTRMVVRLPSAG